MKFILKYLLLFCCLLLILSSCRRDKITTSPAVKLSFSADTVKFDTVFTSSAVVHEGSASRIFKVYNHDSKKLKISSIQLANGSSSFFYLNVDGVAGKTFSNIEINGKDSMYIYVAVTIDQTNATNPFLVYDSILFNTNGNEQHVVLNAYGQNAYFHNGETDSISGIWPTDKPHVIVNSFLVASNTTLTLQPGTRIYMHGNSAFFVNGTLNAIGTKHDSIVFQGDRLEQYYVGLPGNWGYLHFLRSSTDNVLEHVIIKDALYGVIVDSLSNNTNPKLTMRKCMIRNMVNSGISALTGSIKAENCLVYNCGDYCAQLFYGGNYDFKLCTFANYGNIAINHSKPCVALTNYYVDGNNTVHGEGLTATQAGFADCIIYGGLDNELVVDSTHVALVPLNYNFSFCNIKSDKTIGAPNFSNCQQNSDPAFNDYPNDNLTISSSSPCLNHGTDVGIYQDYDDNSRNTQSPSIGCFEK